MCYSGRRATGERPGTVLTDIWSFLQDENNRTVLAWIGSGVAVGVPAIWVVLKFVLSKRIGESAPAPTVTATHNGIAAGRDVHNM